MPAYNVVGGWVRGLCKKLACVKNFRHWNPPALMILYGVLFSMAFFLVKILTDYM